MKLKDLKWRSTTKEDSGYIGFASDNGIIHFRIQNWDIDGTLLLDKVYLYVSYGSFDNDRDYEFESVDKAMEQSQKIGKDIIIDMFFDK